MPEKQNLVEKLHVRVVTKIVLLPSERREFGHDARPLSQSLLEGLRVVEAGDFLAPAQSVRARHLKPKKETRASLPILFARRSKRFWRPVVFLVGVPKKKYQLFTSM